MECWEEAVPRSEKLETLVQGLLGSPFSGKCPLRAARALANAVVCSAEPDSVRYVLGGATAYDSPYPAM